MIEQSTRQKLLLEPESVEERRRNVWPGGEAHVLVPRNRSVPLFQHQGRRIAVGKLAVVAFVAWVVVGSLSLAALMFGIQSDNHVLRGC